MKEIRHYTFSPPASAFQSDNKNFAGRTITLVPTTYGNREGYQIIIVIDDIFKHPQYLRISESRVIASHRIHGRGNGKLFVTVSGIVNGHITGPVAESLMLDIFVEMIIKSNPPWLKKYFPGWDTKESFKLRDEPQTAKNASIISLVDIKKQTEEGDE